MDSPYRDRRKIDPSKGPLLGDGSPNLADRVETGPTPLAFAEWEAAGLALPDLAAMRHYRWRRLVEGIVARDWGGVVLTDPLNIRYATDAPNMQLWNLHNPFRVLLVCADGAMVLWDYRGVGFLSAHNPLVSEVRSGGDLFYFDRGDKVDEAAAALAVQIEDLIAVHGAGNRRLGVDKMMPHGLRALEARGFELFGGEEMTEKARSVKCPNEIRAMRCAIHACEAALSEMEAFARTHCGDGRTTEADVWALMHSGNVRRGGEWIETRLLTSGPRTNPWFQECSGRVVQPDEVLAFDTDLIGPYGICCDMSRTWWIGPGKPRPDIVSAMHHAVEHIQTNTALLRPGLSIPEFVERSHRLAPEFQKQKYGCLAHGVGLCDEWPLVAYPDLAVTGAYDYVLEPGMVLCTEVLVSPEGGDFSIKLEEQVLITETGHEVLTRYPYDLALMGESAGAGLAVSG